MKVSILNTSSTETGKMELPKQFNEPVRNDLVKKAVLAINTNNRQPYGADPEAGKRASAAVSRRRKDYRGAYGIGISRVPRKIMSRRGTRMNWVAAFAPGTVKGRRAHPPKASKVWSMSINKKENRKAIRSAMSATMIKELVRECGHIIPDKYPFIVDNQFESLAKTKDIAQALEKMGFAKELERVSVKKVRPGRGTMRGRRYRKKIGPLLVVSEKCNLLKGARNIAGVEAILVNKLNAKSLTSGIRAGRLAIFTQAAVEKIAKQGLFADKA
jgi:large subunit ribosomal protein L4e